MADFDVLARSALQALGIDHHLPIWLRIGQAWLASMPVIQADMAKPQSINAKKEHIAVACQLFRAVVFTSSTNTVANIHFLED